MGLLLIYFKWMCFSHEYVERPDLKEAVLDNDNCIMQKIKKPGLLAENRAFLYV